MELIRAGSQHTQVDKVKGEGVDLVLELVDRNCIDREARKATSKVAVHDLLGVLVKLQLLALAESIELYSAQSEPILPIFHLAEDKME
jgi:hypothetical protein